MTALDVFFSYSHQDEDLRDALEKHLSLLKRQGFIRAWHDRRIGASEEWKEELDQHLESAHIILLLISADFIASDYCYELEMDQALKRHDAGEARVVPILLRPCDWRDSRFAHLQGLPKDLEPVTAWADQDAALLEVTQELRSLVQQMRTRLSGPEPHFTDPETREQSESIDAAYETRAERIAAGESTQNIDSEIRRLKRLLREEGHPKQGDLLDGRFKLLEPIGQGGFAEVWKAYDRKRRAYVAAKILHSQYGRDKSRRDRFFRGARQMAQLQDLPGIVNVVEEQCTDLGFHFFVMEYVAGGDFHRAVIDGRLDRTERLRIVLEVGEILQQAHERGIVHRDIKPANILLDGKNRPRLTDFDLVRAADTTGGTRTSKLGTFIYAAPEALNDASQASAPADVHGFGMTAIFAVHGAELPVEAFFEPASFIASLDIDQSWLETLSKAVARKIEQRYATAAEFCADLRRLFEAKGGVASEQIQQSPKLEITAQERVHEKDGSVLIFVPGGGYLLGSEHANEASKPVHRAELSGFWIGKYPVTNKQYRRFVEATGHREPEFWSSDRFNKPQQTVVGVSWHEAEAYCEWAGLELPSEAQWEAAARGVDQRAYPWGDEKPWGALADFGKEWDSGSPDIVGIRHGGMGPFGAYDQAGGVWEWCQDTWSKRAYDGRNGQSNPIEADGKNTARVVRGGSWVSPARHLASAFRGWHRTADRIPDLGFRVLSRSRGEP